MPPSLSPSLDAVQCNVNTPSLGFNYEPLMRCACFCFPKVRPDKTNSTFGSGLWSCFWSASPPSFGGVKDHANRFNAMNGTNKKKTDTSSSFSSLMTDKTSNG